MDFKIVKVQVPHFKIFIVLILGLLFMLMKSSSEKQRTGSLKVL